MFIDNRLGMEELLKETVSQAEIQVKN